jgi:RecJ-like exonuclease
MDLFKKLISMIATPVITNSNIPIKEYEIVCTECCGNGWEDAFIPCEFCNGIGKLDVYS